MVPAVEALLVDCAVAMAHEDLRVSVDVPASAIGTTFDDETDRYGDAGAAWCRHDNQWLLSWAISDALGHVDLTEQAIWLARVLHGRGFPVDRLARNLEIAAETAAAHDLGPATPRIAAALTTASREVAGLGLV